MESALQKKRWEAEVKWLGFDDMENTWEPLVTLLEDVPLLAKECVERSAQRGAIVRALGTAWEQHGSV